MSFLNEYLFDLRVVGKYKFGNIQLSVGTGTICCGPAAFLSSWSM